MDEVDALLREPGMTARQPERAPRHRRVTETRLGHSDLTVSKSSPLARRPYSQSSDQGSDSSIIAGSFAQWKLYVLFVFPI